MSIDKELCIRLLMIKQKAIEQFSSEYGLSSALSIWKIFLNSIPGNKKFSKLPKEIKNKILNLEK